MELQKSPAKTRRVVITVDPAFEQRVNDISNKDFEGNRSALVRLAIREFIERKTEESSQNVEAA